MHETLHRYFKAIKELDVDAWLACFAPTCEQIDPVGTPARTTREEMRAFFTGLGGLFESVELVPEKIYPAGRETALTWTAQGVGKNGRPVAFEGIDVFELDEQGLITSIKAYWDMGPTMAALTA